MDSIATSDAPAAVGHYSQAIRVGNVVYCSGQISVEGDAAAQTKAIMKNLSAVLRAAGTSLHHIVKATIFLSDMTDYMAVNAAYAEALGDHKPARACVQVARLPKDARVEIDAIAVIEAP